MAQKIARAARRGRPKTAEKRCKLIAYVKPRVLARAKRAAAISNDSSLSSWAAHVIEREAELAVSKPLPAEVYLPGPRDPRGLTRKALQEDRESSP